MDSKIIGYLILIFMAALPFVAIKALRDAKAKKEKKDKDISK